MSVTGSISKAGGGFTIDHPLDPASRYLSHSFVESSEKKNFYDGFVACDDSGEATVSLPEWFESLNTEVHCQLTSGGARHRTCTSRRNCRTIDSSWPVDLKG